jgi:hypothetical protein
MLVLLEQKLEARSEARRRFQLGLLELFRESIRSIGSLAAAPSLEVSS